MSGQSGVGQIGEMNECKDGAGVEGSMGQARLGLCGIEDMQL